MNEVEIIQIAETEARMNAFLSGEADVVHEMSYLQARNLESDPTATVIVPPEGLMGAFRMRVDLPPFDDVRVRQAMRLAVDRQAMLDSVYYGYGEVGNDIYGKGAPFYNDTLPQRTYDPQRARELLRAAGKANLEVTLPTADGMPGMVESATLFAEHAKAAGITIRLESAPADTYFSQVTGKCPLTHIGWWNYSLDPGRVLRARLRAHWSQLPRHRRGGRGGDRRRPRRTAGDGVSVQCATGRAVAGRRRAEYEVVRRGSYGAV
ncbi:ABC transporter substrate-binding protein [Nocardia sp. NPDC050193]